MPGLSSLDQANDPANLRALRARAESRSIQGLGRRSSETMWAMEPRINFITLVVADLERARRFYLDGLGWSGKVLCILIIMLSIGLAFSVTSYPL